MITFSTLIVTIDEKEYLHLGCLLDELFSEAQIQVVSISINHSGAIRNQRKLPE
jgi:adenine-specific DNA-methyltransferase